MRQRTAQCEMAGVYRRSTISHDTSSFKLISCSWHHGADTAVLCWQQTGGRVRARENTSTALGAFIPCDCFNDSTGERIFPDKRVIDLLEQARAESSQAEAKTAESVQFYPFARHFTCADINTLTPYPLLPPLRATASMRCCRTPSASWCVASTL